MKRISLFFNENPIPRTYTKGTLAAKELRLRAALTEIDEVHVLAPHGKSIQTDDISRGPLEKKIIVHWMIPWAYYGQGLLHFCYGIYYILKLRPVVLEAESPIISGPAVVLLGKIFTIPTIVELRASYEELIKIHAKIIPYIVKKYLLRIVTQFSYRGATAIIANSKTYKRYLNQRGFDSIEINPGLQYAPSKQPPAYDKRKKLIGYIGRLVEEKGIDDLLVAITGIRTRLSKEGWRVLIAGDGVRRNQLEQMSESLGLSKIVRFVGPQYNYGFLEKLKIAVNPCYVKASLEMVNIEAALMGTPMICYGAKGVPETVIHKKTGYTLPYRQVSELRKTILLLMENSQVSKQLSRSGFDFAKRKYSFFSQVSVLKLLYRDLEII